MLISVYLIILQSDAGLLVLSLEAVIPEFASTPFVGAFMPNAVSKRAVRNVEVLLKLVVGQNCPCLPKKIWVRRPLSLQDGSSTQAK